MNKPHTDKELIELYIMELSEQELKDKLQQTLELLVDSDSLRIVQDIRIYHSNSGDDL